MAPGPIAGFASLDVTNTAVEEVIGRPHTTVREFFVANRDTLLEVAV